MDDNGHGTHTSGTIGAVGNNGVGVTGVMCSCRIMPLKFLNASGSGAISGALSAAPVRRGQGREGLEQLVGRRRVQRVVPDGDQ